MDDTEGSNKMMVAAALGPVFLLIALGTALNRWNFPGSGIWPGIERLTYYLLFPALLVHRIALTELSGVPLGRIALVVVAALVLVSLLAILLRRPLRADAASWTSVYQGAIRFNTFIGLAAADALFGESGLALAAIVAGLKIPMVNVGCVSAFALAGTHAQPSVRSVVRGLVTNPLILACLLGLVLNLSGIGLPGWSADTLSFLGAAALPLGLLAVGVGLNPWQLGGKLRLLLWASGLRFVVMPGVLFGLALALDLPPMVQAILVLFGCLPTASSGYILSRQMGGDAALMAGMITVQSLLGFLALPLWMLLFV